MPGPPGADPLIEPIAAVDSDFDRIVPRGASTHRMSDPGTVCWGWTPDHHYARRFMSAGLTPVLRRGLLVAFVAVVLTFLVWGSATAQVLPIGQPTTTTTPTTAPTTTATSTPPDTSASSTSSIVEETVPPETSEYVPPATYTPTTQGYVPPATVDVDNAPLTTAEITTTTGRNLLIPGDGSDGAESTTTSTTTIVRSSEIDRGGAVSEQAAVWGIVAGLAGTAQVQEACTLAQFAVWGQRDGWRPT